MLINIGELIIGRSAKVSDLEKKDLKDFSIGLVEAKKLKITKDDLKGIKEIIPNEKYKIRITIGNRKSEVLEGTLLEAIKRKKELTNLYKNKSITSSDNMMFFECVNLYIDDCYERVKRGNVDINSVVDHIKKIDTDIAEKLYKYKLSEITKETIEDFITYLRNRTNRNNVNKKISETTVSNIIRTLNVILNFAVRKGFITENPYKKVTNKPQVKRYKKELNYFTINEAVYALKCINKFADIRLKTFMNIIFSLGCRREECCGLRWCDIDFETGEVNFNFAVTSSIPKKYVTERVRKKALKTYNSYRTNYLSDNPIKFLKQYYQFKILSGIDVQEDDYVFTNFKNDNITDPNKLSEKWRNFKKIYNIKNVDLHRIRHTVANVLERRGIPKKDIAKFLGNTEHVLEEYYTHIDHEELKNIKNKIDNALFNDLTSVELEIETVAYILNSFPIQSINNNELSKLDLILGEKLTEDNYFYSIKKIKNILLESDSRLTYFIEEDNNILNIKIDGYKKFNAKNKIEIKLCEIDSISKDVFSL